ncbi:hypothetical protein EXU57_10295 [Segetibacter sp. 3557_3]|nr:putative Ig domain-containing protein [Segetibacter sp. 3557_3]TDH26474.1 hypothetical protein EXU57_10295 [Segetibacter sp. 3557_3]
MKFFYSGCLLALAGLLFVVPAISIAQNDTTRTHSRVRVPGEAHLKRGTDAIAYLGTRLPEVANRHRIDASKLKTMFSHDQDLWVGHDDHLRYVCGFGGAGHLNKQQSVRSATGVTKTVEPLAKTFALHSRPGSTKKLYLDFDGHTAVQYRWPQEANNSDAFDFDGDSSTFSPAELERIQHVWQRVAEDFIGFDVDVTTEDPGADGLIRSNGSDQTFGQRVIFTSTPSWYPGASGIAMFNTFGQSTETPCFVFTEYMWEQNDREVADVGSHEAGHTLGLGHDGEINNGNYWEYSYGATGWAPIMGIAYREKLSQWSRGEYGNATNRQDDLEQIAFYLGYAADDLGDTRVSASQLSNENGVFRSTGIIGTSSDVDLFSFTTAAGTIYLNVEPEGAGSDNQGANLDVYLVLLNADGEPVTFADPPDTLGAVIRAVVPAGMYYLRVSGNGKGNPNAGGYSRYGSIGKYLVRVSAVPTSSAPPVITSSLTVSGRFDHAFRFMIEASGSPVAFSASLPAGLSINPGTGMITGKPLMPGTFSVPVTATNSHGQGSAMLELTVLPTFASAPYSPQLLGPFGIEGRVGEPLSYQVKTTRPAVSYSFALLPENFSANTSTGVISGTPLANGNYDVRLYAGDWSGGHALSLYMFIVDQPLRFSGKVLLQGAYRASAGTMVSTLNSMGILQARAATQPYAVGYNYQGAESVPATFFLQHPDIVDWVLVELRAAYAPAIVVARRAAFVKRDGTLVDSDGVTTGISFPGVQKSTYFVTIRHRNHLGIRSTLALDFYAGSANYDFTTAAGKAYQNQSYTSMVQVGDVWLMRSGNANANGNVKANGPENDQNQISNIKLKGLLSSLIINAYAPEDLNMDGTVKTNGPNNDENFLLNEILGGLLSRTYIEQL